MDRTQRERNARRMIRERARIDIRKTLASSFAGYAGVFVGILR